jgi:hypothetical protein
LITISSSDTWWKRFKKPPKLLNLISNSLLVSMVLAYGVTEQFIPLGEFEPSAIPGFLLDMIIVFMCYLSFYLIWTASKRLYLITFLTVVPSTIFAFRGINLLITHTYDTRYTFAMLGYNIYTTFLLLSIALSLINIVSIVIWILTKS